MFLKMLNSKCRTLNLFYIWALFAITLFGAGQTQSSSKEYVIPEFGPRTRADGKDIAPYLISSEQIRTFLDKIKNREAASAVAYGHTVFREHGRLPEDYRNLLSEFFGREYLTWNRQSKNAVYHFDASHGHALSLVIYSNRGLVKLSATVGSSFVSKQYVMPEVVSDEDALQLMRNYVEFHNTKYKPPEDYDIGTAEFGKLTRFLYLTTKDPYHPYTLEFIMYNRDGGIYEKNLETITWTCRREFPHSQDPRLHKIIIETFLRLDDEDQQIISSTDDIPNYSKYKLDPDLEKTVRPMFSFVRRRGYAKEDTLIYIVYTYRQNSGIVRRYRFPFKNKEVLFETPTCVIIGQRIGDAYYLQ